MIDTVGRDRSVLYDRQEGFCWWCGAGLGLRFAAHHRQLRSQGGPDDYTNMVALHHGCHNLNTESVHLNPLRAIDRGFLVPSWDDPAKIPLTLPGGGRVLLKPSGAIEHTQGETDGWH